VGGFIFTSCENEDLNTDQFAGKNVTIRAWGPNPLLRGDTIRFIGTNLNNVTEVIFPENLSVTPIKISNTELRAAAPATAIDGYITLVYPGGKVTTQTQITYADSVVYMEIESEHIPAIAGDTITITGDNFTSVTKVVFFDDVQVLASNFLEQTRYQIKLLLPDEAQTGEVYLLNGEISTYPTTLEITTPSITAITPLTDLKAGRDSVTISGTLLNLAKEFVFAGGAKVAVENTNPDQIKVLIPAEAENGIITLVAKSGLEYPSIDAITLLLPQNISHTTETRYKAGEKIMISGDDLDLVTKVMFNGQSDEQKAEFTYNAETKKITATIPVEAQDGAIKLHTVTGEVVTPDLILVKPIVINRTASIVAGEEFTIEGTDLDLVAEVYVSGELCDTVSFASDRIQVKTPLLDKIANADAPITFTLTNGVTDFAASTINISRPGIDITTANPLEAKVGELIVLEGVRLEEVTSVSFDGAEATKWMYNGGKIFVEVPKSAQTGSYGLTLNGILDPDPVFNITGVGEVENIIHDQMTELDWGDHIIRLDKESFQELAAGSILRFYVSPTGSDPQLALRDANWESLDIQGDPNFDSQWGVIRIPTGITIYEITLTQAILNKILSVDDGWSTTAIIIAGQQLVVSKIATVIKGAPAETVISEETVDFGSWANTLRINKESFEGVRAGTILKLYYTATAENPQFALQDANWAKVDIPDDPNFDPQWGSVNVPADGTTYEIVLTQAILDVILTVDDGWSTTAIIFGGQNMIVSKVTLIN
jgi:hypothetical protein